MRRYVFSMAGGLLAFLMGYGAAMAADIVPDAFTSEGPALAAINGRTVVAWAGDAGVSAHPVWYSSLDGSWTSPARIPNALTTSAPALGVADQRLFLATTPPAADDKIQVYMWDGSAFDANGMDLCDGETCAHTRASPSLVGDGTMLYAAWSTPTGAIRYASMINGVWSIASLPIPNASTSPTTGPTLALFEHQLYVAWVDPSGDAVSVAVATLPLTTSSWSGRRKIPANTHVAPALGVLTVANAPNPTEPNALFVSWTTPESTLSFARWDSSTAEWMPADSPIPLASGPLTSLAPALSGFTTESSNQECYYTNTLVFTGEEKPRHKVHAKQVRQGCP
jgi:hypothetical protein